MTKIEGRAHDDLLITKGFGGFPTLAFMDAEGEILGQPADRSVLSFEACREALMVIDEVSAKADAGDPEALAELLLLENDLGRVEADAFAERAASVRAGASKDQLARLDQALVDNEVLDLANRYYRGEQETAGAGMLALLDAGKRPTASGKYGGNYWGVLSTWARPKGDAKLLRRIAKGIRADFAGDERMLATAGSLEAMATGLDKRDALVARQTKGEKGLEAQILLLEIDLGAISLEELRKRLPAALAVASEDEKKTLAQGEINKEASDLVGQFWGGGDRAELGERMYDILAGDGMAPSGDGAGPFCSCVAYWASNKKDADLMRTVADVMRERYGDDSRLTRLIQSLEDRADKL